MNQTLLERVNPVFILFNHQIVDKVSSLMYNVNGDEK